MKTIKKLSLAILLVLAVAMPFAALAGVKAAPVGTVTLTAPSGSNLAIGSTFTVTAHISGASEIWQWALNNIQWNNAVINYVSTSEGGYSMSAPASGTLFLAPPAPQTGTISQISDTRFALTNPTATSGDLCTITFQVVGYGSTAITVGSAAATNAAQDPSATLTVTGTTYNGLPPPSPFGPTAIISAPIDNAFVLQGTAIALDGSASTGGYNGGSKPITSYAWTINGAGIVNLNLNGATPGSVTPSIAGDLSITLTVTATGANPETSVKSVTIHVYAPALGASLDIFTQRGGVGPSASSDAFGPQQNIILYGVVKHNNVAVVGKEVSFQIMDKDGNVIAIRSAISNATGVATTSYRLPWPDTNPEGTFGTWSVNATVDVSEVVVSDICTFTFNYLLKTTTVVTQVSPTHIAATSFARANPAAGAIEVKVTVQNIAVLAGYTGKICVTLYDEANVPVATIDADMSVNPSSSNALTQTLTIPHYAFVGQATAYINIMTNFPSVGGVPFCPETAQAFSITA